MKLNFLCEVKISFGEKLGYATLNKVKQSVPVRDMWGFVIKLIAE